MSQEAELLSNSVKAKMLQMPNYVILVCKLYLMIPNSWEVSGHPVRKT